MFTTVDALSTGSSRVIKQWWTNSGAAAWGELGRKCKQTGEGEGHLCMMAEGESGPELVWIDIREGTYSGRIRLGEKDTSYLLDPYRTDTMYYKPDDTTILCYRF